MFFVWGWRAVAQVVGLGVFFCPQCQHDQPYRLVSPRQWFTIFFIPAIPMRRLDRYVACDGCRGSFVEQALATPTSGQLEHQLGLATRAAVAHLVVESGHDVAVSDAAVRLLAGAPGVHGYDAESLRSDAAAFTDAQVALHYVSGVAPHLSLAGKEDFVRRLLALAPSSATGTRLASATEAVAGAVDLSPAHLAGVRAQLTTDGAA